MDTHFLLYIYDRVRGLLLSKGSKSRGKRKVGGGGESSDDQEGLRKDLVQQVSVRRYPLVCHAVLLCETNSGQQSAAYDCRARLRRSSTCIAWESSDCPFGFQTIACLKAPRPLINLSEELSFSAGAFSKEGYRIQAHIERPRYFPLKVSGLPFQTVPLCMIERRV